MYPRYTALSTIYFYLNKDVTVVVNVCILNFIQIYVPTALH